ncbi:hypothetical protein A1O1_07401 [Capronia coronata CBS 617.96]|uniref:N-acetyltransferase domain-containing protein n=1 Tax=Capronia coronata CBS 617.96 TaxID=1182541 RepID=W9YND5_9EURO|nr:uncharacterized protein A1O1_07401 [Capronia coronata CBS 617.96]EXJ83774.1 hypothetical protein A1O1_07401 [Capronia coronata CBS 617.96]
MVVATNAHHADHVVFKDLRSLPRSSVSELLLSLQNLEKKQFASNEVFPFDDKLLAKQNTAVIVGVLQLDSRLQLVAYAVCVRWNHRLLLHKICVAPAYRQKGMGTKLMRSIIDRARQWSCRGIDLWVDEANDKAQGLYSKHNFEIQQSVPDYYGPGRHGVKMCHVLQP